MDCDTCYYNCYDEEYDEYYCSQFLDEDDVARMVDNPSRRCPYWREGDDYTLARKQ